jgi:hypothetical protein
MINEKSLAVFEDYKIRRHYDEEKEIWYFSVIDIVGVLIQQSVYQTVRKYWNKLKERLKKEGSESVTKCHQLKFEAADGKKYLTDAADPETLLRLIICEEQELTPVATHRKFLSVRHEGGRQVKR